LKEKALLETYKFNLRFLKKIYCDILVSTEVIVRIKTFPILHCLLTNGKIGNAKMA